MTLTDWIFGLISLIVMGLFCCCMYALSLEKDKERENDKIPNKKNRK